MKMTSTAFKNNDKIPKKYTADGENINPPLTISEIPSDAVSLVLICEDPDAERVVGHTWIHWVVFNIPVKGETLSIKENSIPGTPGESTYKKAEYGGPSPPKGTGVHNYFFKIYALDKKLNLPKMASLDSIKKEMEDSIIELYDLVGEYWRD